MLKNNATTLFSKEDTLLYKGIGILLIVLHNFFHWVSPNTGENEWSFSVDTVHNLYNGLVATPLEFVNLLFSYFGHYGVQLFIFISGAGLTLSMQNRSRTWGAFMVERLKKLYPLLIVGFVFCFFANILMNENLYDGEFRILGYTLLFLNTLIPDTWGGITGPWWFFGLIFQLYVLFPLLYKVIKKYRLYAFIGICLISYAWMYFSLYPDYFHYPKTGILLLQNAPGHLPEFALGILMALNGNKKLRFGVVILSLVVFVLGNFYPFFFPLTFLTVSVLIYWSISKIIPLLNKMTKLKTILLFYGSISYVIFVIHGPFRIPFITVSGTTTSYGKLFGAALFLITITALSVLGNMLYKWMLKKIETVFHKQKTAGVS